MLGVTGPFLAVCACALAHGYTCQRIAQTTLQLVMRGPIETQVIDAVGNALLIFFTFDGTTNLCMRRSTLLASIEYSIITTGEAKS